MKTLKKYLLAFSITILIMISLLVIEKAIPNTRSKQNILASEKYYVDYYKTINSNINLVRNKYTQVDMYGELYHISNIYLEENKHPYKEFVEMNMDADGIDIVLSGHSFKEFEVNTNYSRYWNGALIVFKPLLSFFTVPTINKILLVVFSITYLLFLFFLLKHDKLLAILIVLASIMMNLFLVTKGECLFYVFMISMITSMITIKMYEKKSKNIPLLIFITGMVTCYFDMLSCESVTMTIPLFIYLYLSIKDNRKVDWQMILRSIGLWFLGFFGAYAIKWILAAINYKGGFKENVAGPLQNRVAYANESRMITYIRSIKDLFHYIIPHESVAVIVSIIIGFISSIYLIIKDKKNRSAYLLLLLLSFIPFLRYYILAQQSDYHNFYTYRAFIIMPMVSYYFIIATIKNFIRPKITK